MSAIYIGDAHAERRRLPDARRAPRRTPLVNAAAAKPQVHVECTRPASATGGTLDAVRHARERRGNSWTEVGAGLGMTRQGAQRKYGDRVP